MSKLSVWTPGWRDETSKVLPRHEQLANINQTVTEYAELIEGVSVERADLMMTISKLKLQNAELSVSKALFADLEAELGEFRKAAQEAERIVATNRTIMRELEAVRNENADLKQQVATLKGQITRMKNRNEAGI